MVQRPTAQRQLPLRRSRDGAVILKPRSNKGHSSSDVGLGEETEETEAQPQLFNHVQPPRQAGAAPCLGGLCWPGDPHHGAGKGGVLLQSE